MEHKIIDDCIEAIQKAIQDELEYDAQADSAVACVDTNDGYIDLYSGFDGNTADVVHEDDKEHDNSTLEKAIADAMPDFSVCSESVNQDNEYDEWDDHGFRDEQDYIHWKYGS